MRYLNLLIVFLWFIPNLLISSFITLFFEGIKRIPETFNDCLLDLKTSVFYFKNKYWEDLMNEDHPEVIMNFLREEDLFQMNKNIHWFAKGYSIINPFSKEFNNFNYISMK